jgi:hypothetical protein
MIMKRNPIAITPLPLAGRQLDPNWKKSTNEFGGNFDDGIFRPCGRIHNGQVNLTLTTYRT